MTDKQPDALRLADKLQHQVEFGSYNWSNAETLMLDATDELRRLHAENADFRAVCDHLTRENAEQIGEIVVLKGQRDELLEELTLLLELHDASGMPNGAIAKKARAAIAKAGGET